MFKFGKCAVVVTLLYVFALAASACTYDPDRYEEHVRKITPTTTGKWVEIATNI